METRPTTSIIIGGFYARQIANKPKWAMSDEPIWVDEETILPPIREFSSAFGKERCSRPADELDFLYQLL